MTTSTTSSTATKTAAKTTGTRKRAAAPKPPAKPATRKRAAKPAAAAATIEPAAVQEPQEPQEPPEPETGDEPVGAPDGPQEAPQAPQTGDLSVAPFDPAKADAALAALKPNAEPDAAILVPSTVLEDALDAMRHQIRLKAGQLADIEADRAKLDALRAEIKPAHDELVAKLARVERAIAAVPAL